ncbi:hypothetical protein [Hymenobacter cheonanensis]|uniref:hypothetical protein n=1 Tax=Hymenobacter sp. CA2-7 TaxID=3063993 RepID=UPI0027138B1E|nr:hypothetical protein [Hymenobacter sp. CA2-7]MDO7884883.1 hypothetical protein [Hymenobacter sp. CA2-7]
MPTQPTLATSPLGRLLAAPLLLALTFGSGCSQKAEQPGPGSTANQPLKVSNALIYIDAQRQDSIALHRLKPQDIASINVLKGDEARDYDPGASAAGVLVVTTKQNEHRPDVVAFNARQHLGSTPDANALAQQVAKLPASAAYFLNGKASTREAVAALDPKAITRMDVLKGTQAAAFAHDEKVQLVLSVFAK